MVLTMMKVDGLLNPLQPSYCSGTKRSQTLPDLGGETKKLCRQPIDAISGSSAFETSNGQFHDYNLGTESGFVPTTTGDHETVLQCGVDGMNSCPDITEQVVCDPTISTGIEAESEPFFWAARPAQAYVINANIAPGKSCHESQALNNSRFFNCNTSVGPIAGAGADNVQHYDLDTDQPEDGWASQILPDSTYWSSTTPFTEDTLSCTESIINAKTYGVSQPLRLFGDESELGAVSSDGKTTLI